MTDNISAGEAILILLKHYLWWKPKHWLWLRYFSWRERDGLLAHAFILWQFSHYQGIDLRLSWRFKRPMFYRNLDVEPMPPPEHRVQVRLYTGDTVQDLSKKPRVMRYVHSFRDSIRVLVYNDGQEVVQ